MNSYLDTFSGALLPPIYNQFNSVSFSTDITLSWPTQFQNGNQVVASIMNFTPAAGGLTVTMPDATQNSVGAQFLLNNLAAHSFNLLNNAGGLITTPVGPSVNLVYLSDNSTIAGTWFQVPFGGGYSAVTSVGANTVDGNDTANLTIGNSPITTTGNLTFTFIGDLGALINFGTNTGFAVRTAADTWALRTLTGVANQIVIPTNPAGIAGNPVIGLAADITGVTSATIGNILISGNAISAIAGGDIELVPQSPGGFIVTQSPIEMQDSAAIRFYNSAGTFYLSLDGGETTGDIELTLPDTAPTTGQALYYAGGGLLGWLSISGFSGSSTINSLPKFTDTVGTIGDTGIIVDNSNNMSGVNSIIAQNIRIAFAGANIISTSSGNLTLTPAGTNETQSTNNLSVLGGNALKLFNVANNGYAGFSGSTAGAAATNIWTLPATDGASGTFLQTNGAHGLSFSALSTQFLAKAYAVFNGTGSVTISNMQGITSITYTSLGVYAVTFATAFANAGYGFTFSLGTPSTGAMPGFMLISARTTTTCTISAFNAAGAAADFGFVTAAFWGNQ